MTIEPVSKADSPGAPKAKATCDACGHTELAPADYTRTPKGAFELRDGQVRTRLLRQGWSFVKNTLRCPSCEAKRKEPAVSVKTEIADTPEASRAQRRQIMALLQDVYDVEAGRYRSGETDKTVAEAIGGGVRAGWVAELREDFFGPGSENEDMAVLEKEMQALAEKTDAALRDARVLVGQLAENATALSHLRVELDAVKKAVGPRAVTTIKEKKGE